MMTVSSTPSDIYRDCNSMNSPKQNTPFSIDDILSNTKRKSGGSIPTPPQSVSSPSLQSHLFFNFPVFSSSHNSYLSWLEKIQKLCHTTSLHPLWVSSFYSNFFSELNFHQSVQRSHVSNNKISQTQNKKSSSSALHAQKMNRKRKLSQSSETSRDVCDLREVQHSEKRKNGSYFASDLQHRCEIEDEDRETNKKSPGSDSPLSALEKLTCTTFKNMEDKQNMLHAVAAGREAKVKRRKCRTAFTTFQLSVLEQRFKCHKYLTPTDRDQIAHILGLSAPQVITWFQNRRAKQKRDLEELKNDIKTVKKWTNQQIETTESESNSPPNENDEMTDIDVESC